METERLLTSWGEYEAAVAQALPRARHSIAIFDRDLSALRLDKPAACEALAAFLRGAPGAELRIVVQSAQPFLAHNPRLVQLLRLSAHNFRVVEAPPQLARLSDSLLLVDATHAVIRFHQEQPRSKEIMSDAEACKPYCKRFEEIWAEGGTPISATTLGL